MSTKAMYDLKETLCASLEPYAKKDGLTRGDLETVSMIVETIKNTEKISAMEEEGYSYGDGTWVANGSYSNGMPMPYGRTSGRRGSRAAYPDARMYPDSGMNYSGDSNDMEYRMRREMNY